MKRRALTVFVTFVVASGLVVGVPARAQTAGVTLKASRTTITYGTAVVLSGKVTPQHPGEQVQIVNEAGEVVAQALTDEQGRYSVRYAPAAITTLRAQWLAALSDPVEIQVKPRLRVKLRSVRLFSKSRISGTIAPAHEGGRVTVRLHLNGRPVRERKVVLRKGLRFSLAMHIARPGRYRATASFDDDDHLKARKPSRAVSTPTPSLSPGARGRYVHLLEQRLRRLGYHITGVNERYDYRTSDAVIAFHKVQSMERVGTVSPASWRALANPRKPRPRGGKSWHIEIDQTKQVIYTVRKGRVENILHTSTGAGGATRDGTFHVTRKLAGYSGGGLYYPSYFDGLRAIHGWEEVPTYPASHGCARVPMWAAQWIYGLADIGTEVLIYH
ncbi:MAG: L,D-transpeptidase family protein [Actinomycetota bacterium]